jgi:hypothetical protein
VVEIGLLLVGSNKPLFWLVIVAEPLNSGTVKLNWPIPLLLFTLPN